MRLLVGLLLLVSLRAHADIDRSVVKKAVAAKQRRIAACRKDPTQTGRVDVIFTITKAGTVDNATATGMGEEVAGCVARVFKTLVFPRSSTSTTLHYPVVFADRG